ncbi:MAG: DMT family transporter [Trueperaceae bacterium]
MPLPAFFALVGVAVLWGSAFPLIKVGLEGLSVPHLTLARHLTASLAFVPFLLLSRSRLRPERRDVPWFLLLGFTGMFVYHMALNAGEVRVSAGATSLIIAAAPAITALLAHWILHDRLPAAGWAGSLLSFAGVVLIVLGDGAGLRIDPFAGFVLISAFATSTYFVLQQRMFARYKAVEVTAFVTWGGTLPMLVFLPGLPLDLADAPIRSVVAAGYIGLFPSAVAYTLFAFAQARAPVTQVTTMLYTIPLFSLLFSWWWLGEVPNPLTIVGGLVVILGIAVVQRSRRAHRGAPAVRA